eukprot:CAMPEP_0174725842 /NCGR_PEP_ID=MMETSP1094-20130205/46535_1 /TAXON_ID=156173 /ORGANISM="Chrysochromulina brevifilum, Strain UTEX LB 985" /LENGTH=139 /DNA_ID=CAMNT_0015927321 /DNA_START=47 /DNA_END=467 /DNA_ORIENTATION=+
MRARVAVGPSLSQQALVCFHCDLHMREVNPALYGEASIERPHHPIKDGQETSAFGSMVASRLAAVNIDLTSALVKYECAFVAESPVGGSATTSSGLLLLGDFTVDVLRGVFRGVLDERGVFPSPVVLPIDWAAHSVLNT